MFDQLESAFRLPDDEDPDLIVDFVVDGDIIRDFGIRHQQAVALLGTAKLSVEDGVAPLPEKGGCVVNIYIPDEGAARAAFAAHKADAIAKGEKVFSRRRVIAIADLFGVKPMAMVWWLEKRGLMRRGSYAWFKANGGITYDDVVQCRVDREASRPTPSVSGGGEKNG
ncbi:MAG TPA: hypothetical protein PK857_00400 [Hyphomicrobium sp.]|nr:hypothetical protein [Hyphomicrobium sp.]HRO48800.1 hypothetical protein [Hyphomicrobium sp.]